MLGEEDKKIQPSSPQPSLAAAEGDHRQIYSRSVSWAAGRSPVKSTSANSKSLWNSKERGCLPPLQPLSVSRPKAQEWPQAGSDDLGVWPNVVSTTLGVRSRLSALPLNLDKRSDVVAKNRDVLRQNRITHVLNCVGFVCPEYFKKVLVYKTRFGFKIARLRILRASILRLLMDFAIKGFESMGV
ncbi:hypothetical protein L6452_40559 [Arctium lappa]|uniref:Uncharacterized protein n=1 Tax=Arctium lappa TaxID=4217 RepID=A0ACB8XMT6_ARCLA|nr:hypothetical protein L6452_40559 [Arctium lappa]